MSRGFVVVALIIAGLGLGILGWAESESVHVANIHPLSEAIHVTNVWLWSCAYPGVVLIALGFILLASGWANKNK